MSEYVVDRIDRKGYYAARYANRRLLGKCTRGNCDRDPVDGQALCEYHRDRNLYTNKFGPAAKRRRMERKVRERLPADRNGVTQRFVIMHRTEAGEVQEFKGYIQTGEYEDGRLGEIFVRVGKAGSSEALLDQWAISTSIALQYGASVGEIFSKFMGTSFEPSGAVQGVEGIKRCTSVLDLVARAIIRRYDVPQTQEQA